MLDNGLDNWIMVWFHNLGVLYIVKETAELLKRILVLAQREGKLEW